jgi:hypothetical protein
MNDRGPRGARPGRTLGGGLHLDLAFGAAAPGRSPPAAAHCRWPASGSGIDLSAKAGNACGGPSDVGPDQGRRLGRPPSTAPSNRSNSILGHPRRERPGRTPRRRPVMRPWWTGRRPGVPHRPPPLRIPAVAVANDDGGDPGWTAWPAALEDGEVGRATTVTSPPAAAPSTSTGHAPDPNASDTCGRPCCGPFQVTLHPHRLLGGTPLPLMQIVGYRTGSASRAAPFELRGGEPIGADVGRAAAYASPLARCPW